MPRRPLDKEDKTSEEESVAKVPKTSTERPPISEDGVDATASKTSVTDEGGSEGAKPKEAPFIAKAKEEVPKKTRAPRKTGMKYNVAKKIKPPKPEDFGCPSIKKLTSFLIFRKEQTKHVQEQLNLSQVNADISFHRPGLASQFANQAKVLTVIAEMWKKLPRYEQEKYYEKARIHAREQLIKTKEWKESESYQTYLKAKADYEIEKDVSKLRKETDRVKKMRAQSDPKGIEKAPPRGGFAAFFADKKKRAEITEEYELWRLPSRDVARALAQVWKVLAEEERKSYEVRAWKMQEAHQRVVQDRLDQMEKAAKEAKEARLTGLIAEDAMSSITARAVSRTCASRVSGDVDSDSDSSGSEGSHTSDISDNDSSDLYGTDSGDSDYAMSKSSTTTSAMSKSTWAMKKKKSTARA